MERIRNEKLKVFADYLIEKRICDSYSDFAAKLGKHKNQIGEVLRGNRTVTPKFVGLLKECFPMVDAEWLLNDNNESLMLSLSDYVAPTQSVRPMTSQVQELVTDDSLDKLTKVIEKQQEQIDRLLGIIEKLQK